jgi:tetratricopeptide (TPR) repeat protein
LALRDQNKPAEANAAFDCATELYRNAPELTPLVRRSMITAVLRQKGALDENAAREETLAAYRQAIEASPEKAGDYWRAIGDIHRGQKKLDQAISAYRAGTKADPERCTNHRHLGDALLQNGELDEAVAAYGVAIKLAPTPNMEAASYFMMGNALARQKKRPEAIAAFSRALELDPKSMSGVYHNIGAVLCAMGNLDEAIAWHKRSLDSIDSKFRGSVQVSIGEVLLQQNKFDEAAAIFRQVIDTEENSPRSHQYLAWILASRPEPHLRDPGQAVVLAKRAVELAKSSETTWQFLGWVHYRTGDWKASIEDLEKSCKLQPGGTGDSGQWIVLALAHARLAAQDGVTEKEREQHKMEARRWFEKADKLVDTSWHARPGDVIGRAIWDFREEARDLLGAKDGKK